MRPNHVEMVPLLSNKKLNTMNRTIGIILVLIGLISGIYALTLHEDEKSLLHIGNIEVKKENKSPSRKSSIGYAVAILSLVGGILVLSSKSNKLS